MFKNNGVDSEFDSGIGFFFIYTVYHTGFGFGTGLDYITEWGIFVTVLIFFDNRVFIVSDIGFS